MVKDEFLYKVECGVDGDTNSTNLHLAKKKIKKNVLMIFYFLSLPFPSSDRDRNGGGERFGVNRLPLNLIK